MKKLFLLLAMVGLVAISCEGGLDNEENGGNTSTPKIELSQQTIEVDFEPNTYTVSVTSPYSWKAESDNEWIVVESTTGIAGTEELSFRVECNKEEKERKGTILLTNSEFDLATELYITQKSFISKIDIEPETLSFAAEGGTQEVTITSNCEYEVSTDADWLTITKTENGITVSASNSADIEERSADITISSEKYGVSKTVKVSQNCLIGADCIFYTSGNGKIVTPNSTYAFGANIVSNTYENGKGVIKFDAPVTEIGEMAFYYCRSLTSVIIPDSVTEIGGSAFYECSSLTSVIIPDSVTSIGKYAFSHCYNLTSITIPDSVTSIGKYAFSHCSSLTRITIPDSVTSIGDYAFFHCSSLTSVTIGKRVTSIGEYAFWACSSLTSITIPDSVTSIGEYAFWDCKSLTSITIPDSVTKIGDGAFYICSSLKTFYGKYASSDNRCLIIDGVLNSFAPVGLTSYTIPNSVTTIGYGAFANCSSLTSITIPDSVTSIGEWAFANCSSLTSVNIPDSVTSIGEDAFANCSSLTSITIPDSVTSIGEDAFSGCI